MSANASPVFPIPVTLLTGFLGSGKTTLLNRMLKDERLADTAVVVNEFGEVGIDHLLVEAASDGVIELSDGCLCCTVRGELVDTLAALAERARTAAKPFRRVVIETTGLADPVPVLVSLTSHPLLVQAFSLDGVVTTLDALTGAETLRDREEARRQLAVADRIVLTKTDLASAAGLAGAEAAIRGVNTAAPILRAAGGDLDPGLLTGCGLVDRETRRANLEGWLHPARAAGGPDGHHHAHAHAHSHGHGSIGSFSIEREAPVPLAAIEAFLDLLRATRSGNLLRMKAVIHTSEDPARPLVLHGVGAHLHPPARLARWPDGMKPGSRLVLIGDGLDEAYVRDLFAAFAGEPQADRPDAAALTDNPLAVPGLSF